jgi:hypothetical protein
MTWPYELGIDDTFENAEPLVCLISKELRASPLIWNE